MIVRAAAGVDGAADVFLLVVEVEDGEMYSVSEELVSGSCIFEVGFERWKRVLPRGVLLSFEKRGGFLVYLCGMRVG